MTFKAAYERTTRSFNVLYEESSSKGWAAVMEHRDLLLSWNFNDAQRANIYTRELTQAELRMYLKAESEELRSDIAPTGAQIGVDFLTNRPKLVKNEEEKQYVFDEDVDSNFLAFLAYNK